MSDSLLTTYAAQVPAAALVLAHGAGAGQKSAWIVKAAQALAASGVSCATFDFPYIAAGRKVPDRAPVLEAHWRAVLDEAKRTFAGLPLFIGGKSMGGRIASQIAAQGVNGVAGLVCFGYPLHPPGRPEQRRDTHLPSITLPMLFIQGSVDQFGNEGEMRELVSRLPAATLHVVPGGDHSFKVRGGAKAVQTAFDGVLGTVVRWMQQDVKIR